MAALSNGDLSKRLNKEVLYNAIVNKTKLQTGPSGSGKTITPTGKIKIVYGTGNNVSKHEYAKLTLEDIEAYVKKTGKKDLEIEGTEGSTTKYIKLTKIFKSEDFGGKSSKPVDEVGKIGNLHGLLKKYKDDGKGGNYVLTTPSSTEKGELAFMKDINSTITSPITLKIGNETYENVCGVNKVKGTPKADLVFVSLIKNKFKEVCWISHKMGSKASEFNQWSGVSKREPEIAGHAEVKAFMKKSIKTFPKGIPAETSVYEKIKDPKLKIMAVFGAKVDMGTRGPSNIDFVMQGNPKLSDDGTLTMSGSIHANGVLPTKDFEPVLNLVYKGDRSDFGISKARASIYPLGGRKQDPIGEWISKNQPTKKK